MKIWAVCVVSLALADAAWSQSAIERHIWQQARSFVPYSRTASMITGSIKLSGNLDFATKGSQMKIAFANGSSVDLKAESASYRQWDLVSHEKRTAEVFEFALIQGSSRMETRSAVAITARNMRYSSSGTTS